MVGGVTYLAYLGSSTSMETGSKMAFNCKVPSYYYVQAMNESILTRNACIAEPHKAQWGAGEGP